MSSNKILFITNSFGMGGAEKLLIDITKTLLGKGYGVDVLTFSDKGVLREEMHKTCKVFTLFDSRLHFFLFRKLRMYRRLRINRFVVNGNYTTVVGFMEGKPTALLADISCKIGKMAWIHTDFRKLNIGLTEQDMYHMYAKVDKILCVSCNAEKAFFEKLPKLAVDSEVIYNLIDEEEIRQKAVQEKITNIVFTFLNIGMLRPEKRQDRLVRAAAALKSKGYKFQIQIIGDGPLRKKLEKLIFELDVADCVFLLGLKENPYPYLKSCDCFVLSSEYEGYGIAIKEALFFKKLIISTNVVGPREILKNGKLGRIVDNTLAGVLEGMQVSLMGNSGKHEVENQDNVEIISKLLRLFARG